MKKLLFACLFGAVGFAAQAQTDPQTGNPTQQTQNCCAWDTYVYLHVNIDPMLCIRLDGDDDASVRYECPSDFENAKTFKKNNGSSDFKFYVWANQDFDISAHRHGDFSGPGANDIDGSNAQVALVAKSSIGGVSPALGAYNDIPYYNPAGLANNAPENIVSEAPPTAGNFTLAFRLKALANAWQYAPGTHNLDVHVTITND